MAITVYELPAYLRRIAARVGENGPRAAAEGMSRAYQSYVVRSMKGPAPSPPGSPPARRTGTLARSVRWTPAVPAGAWRAKSSVAPHTVYARIQNQGGVIWAKHTIGTGPGGRIGPVAAGAHPIALRDLGYLRFEVGGKVIYARSVKLPARPYMVMTPEARQQVRDGAIAAIQMWVP